MSPDHPPEILNAFDLVIREAADRAGGLPPPWAYKEYLDEAVPQLRELIDFLGELTEKNLVRGLTLTKVYIQLITDEIHTAIQLAEQNSDQKEGEET